MAKTLETRFPSAEAVAQWIVREGFDRQIGESFIEQGMDGEAIVSAFGVACGPDCLKEVVKRYGDRLKIYRKLKTLIEQEQNIEAAVRTPPTTIEDKDFDLSENTSLADLGSSPLSPLHFEFTQT